MAFEEISATAGDFVDDIYCTLHQLSPRVRVTDALRDTSRDSQRKALSGCLSHRHRADSGASCDGPPSLPTDSRMSDLPLAVLLRGCSPRFPSRQVLNKIQQRLPVIFSHTAEPRE